jgi:hypothetical protein
MTLQRDQAIERGDGAMQLMHTLTQANNNADRMIKQLVQERNEAWDERDLMGLRVNELEEYNINLHKEFHVLYNGVGPYAPPGAVGMDVDEDEPAASPGGDGDVSDPDDGPDE